jgi:hypothetical protein
LEEVEMTNEEIMLAWNQECKIERGTTDLIIAFARLIAERQREEDARICENLPWKFRTEFCPPVKDECAAAIRKGGVA